MAIMRVLPAKKTQSGHPDDGAESDEHELAESGIACLVYSERAHVATPCNESGLSWCGDVHSHTFSVVSYYVFAFCSHDA